MSALTQAGEGPSHWTTDYRDVPHEEILRVASRLVASVSEHHGTEVGAHVAQDLLSSSREGAYLVWCDQERHGLRMDEARDFLWVAAGLGHSDAKEALLGLVSKRPVARKSSANRRPAPPSAADHAEFFSNLRPAPQDADRGRPFDPVADPDPGPFATEAAAEATAAVPLPGRVVIPRVGDPDSTFGRELAKRYKGVVGESLPFLGQVPALDDLSTAIRRRWPWAARAADQLERHMSVLRTAGTVDLRLQPLLFVGAPGCGKTSVARFLATVLDLPSVMVSCGGTADAGGLAAVTRGWATARPSMVTAAYADFRCANPVVVLDEIDKSSRVGAHNGSVQGTLLQMLGAEDYHDSCLMGPVDMRSTSFVATANHLPQLDPGLLERFEVVTFDPPAPEHFDVLLANCRSDFARQNDLSDALVPTLDRRDLRTLREQWTRRGRSARAFAKIHDTIVKDVLLHEERRAVAEERRAEEARAVAMAEFAAVAPMGVAN